MFAFAHPRARRKPALTPLIDVVFLLLVFFMLAAQFGHEGALGLAGAGASGDYTGPPRLVTILPEGLLLNGVVESEHSLANALTGLIETPADTVVLQARDGASVQRLADIAATLSEAGFTQLVLVE